MILLDFCESDPNIGQKGRLGGLFASKVPKHSKDTCQRSLPQTGYSDCKVLFWDQYSSSIESINLYEWLNRKHGFLPQYVQKGWGKWKVGGFH